ncbi:MAG: FtsQ-type POTRA domain-containing protein [Lachnospiraceae bacterium]|nr:FtsQ-type POTRA domain-containing protein [Lachnospiraceae bacterium]
MSRQQDNVIQFKLKKKGMVIGILVTILLVAFIILLTCFKIEDIEISGNKHYTKEQIKDYVLSNGYIDNTVLLMLKNRIKPIEDIPFVAKLDVEYISAHRVAVTVYEKALAGCVEYMERYVYFDQDGYVMEISATKLPDSPCISGMSFSSMELHEKLPIDDINRFKLILKLTQLINKYELKIDSIKFTSEGEIVMTYADIRIELGDGSNLEEQLLDLNRILAGLEGKKGTLDLKDFDTATGKASFKLKKE